MYRTGKEAIMMYYAVVYERATFTDKRAMKTPCRSIVLFTAANRGAAARDRNTAAAVLRRTYILIPPGTYHVATEIGFARHSQGLKTLATSP